MAPPRRSKKRRRRDELLPTIATAAFVAAGAWLASWWIVPVAALAAGAIWWKRADVAKQAMWGAVVGWLLLLLVDSLHGRTWALAMAMGGAVFLPWGLVLVVTLLYAAGLGWSAATVSAFATGYANGKKAKR